MFHCRRRRRSTSTGQSSRFDDNIQYASDEIDFVCYHCFVYLRFYFPGRKRIRLPSRTDADGQLKLSRLAVG